MSTAVTIAGPTAGDESAFLAAVGRSRALHGDWVSAPATPGAFRRYREVVSGERYEGFLVRHGPELVGVVNLNEIVRGAFLSAYLGYYAFEPLAGRGLMRRGLALVVDAAFGELRLHRLEANVQPDNERSIRLVRSLGFRREGFSPRYLHIAGRWRDHERWALLADEWPGAGGVT